MTVLTDFIQYEHQPLRHALPPPDRLLDEPAPAPIRIACVEVEDDDVALVDDLVQGTNVVPP